MSTPELGSLLEEDELNSRSGSPHSSDSSSYISSDLFSSDDSGDESGNKSNASSDFGSLPEIAGRTASQTLLIAKQNTTKLGKLHRKKAPGLQKGGLEQETVLAFPWKRTRNLIHALGVQKKMAHSPNRKHRKAVKKGLRIGTLSGSFPDVKAPRVSMAAGAAAKVDKARAAVFAGVLSARVKELEFRKKGRGSFRVSTVSENSELRDSNESISGIMELVDAPLSRNLTVPFADIREVEPDENLGLEEEEEEEEEDLGDEKSGPILPITIPHGFQLLRTLVQPKPCVKSVINVSANNTDSFAVLDTYQARLIRGTMKVAGISVGEEKSVPDSHLTGLNRWIFISKWRITIIATLHLELKVLGLSLELLSQVSSVKPVLCLDFHDARDELIAGGVGNIRIWTVSQLKGTYRLSGPRLIIDDLQSEEWITHIVHNAYLNRLMVACDCDLLIYDYNTGKRIDRLRGIHELSISVMIFYEPHQYLITASKDSNIKVWTRYNQFILELKSPTSSPVTGLSIVNPEDQETTRHTFLMSSYQDGAIRMWNMDSGHLVYKYETFSDCLGLGWLRPDVFYHYSKDRICVWNLNRRYVGFSSINSAVTHIRRIEVPGFIPRILVAGSDCSVKLLSPVTGATLFTAFPVIKDSMIRSVEYDIVSNMIWTLTFSGDIFVYSTVMNPCKVVDEWKVQAGKDLVTCMSALRIAPKGGKRSLTTLKSPAIYTLIGGTDSGQIVTLDIRVLGGETKILSQAHTAAISDISCYSEKLQIISAGHDGLIKMWAINWADKMDTTSKDAENPDLCLQIIPYSTINSLHIFKLPKGIGSNISLNVGAEAIAVSTESQLVLFNWDYQGLSEMRKKHATDEDHLKRITFVSQLSSLKLFATSSEDGTAKIWDAEANSLIREIQFNEPISSVCFCNDKGDLLVGLPNQLVLVRVHDYLPQQFLADLIVKSEGWPDDPIESPKPFDSDLDFWELYRLGLEKIGADLTKWHIAFQRRSADEERLAGLLADLERKRYDAEEQRKRKERQEKKRRHQLRQMTAEEQRKLLESLGLLDNLKTINLMDLLRHRKAQNEMKIDLSELDKYLDGRISEERKEKERRMAEVQTPHIQEGRRRPTLKNVYDKHMKRKGKFIQVVEDAYEKAMNPPTPQRQGSMSKNVPKRRDSASVSIPKSASNQRRSSQVQFGRKSITSRKPSFSLDQAAKTSRLALVSRNPNEKPKAKELFPGKSKTWIQNHFMKLGLLPNSILAGEIEGEARKKERLEKEKKAAAVIQAMQEAANKKAMADRVKNVRRSNKFLSETVKYMQSEVDLGDDGEFEEEELPERPALKFDDTGPEPVYEDLEEIERKRREAEEAERLQRLAEEEEARRLAAELEAELRAQRERDEAEIQAKKDEQERLKREKAEAEEAERLRLKAEKEARRKAELDAKLAVKRAKKEAMDAIMMAKKAAEAEEAERRKRLEDEKRKAAQPSTTYGAIKDFVPVTDTEKRTIVAQDVFSAREKGTLYKAPPPPTIKKSERKPIVPWKRRPNDKFEGLNKIGDDSNSDLSGSDEEEDDFDPEALTGLWDNANEDVAKTAWNLIDISKKTAERKPSIRASTLNRKGSTGKADDIKQELKNIIGNHWFPGLDPGMEANLQNILKVLFKTMKSGLWREKSEACKAVLYLYQTFEKDFQDPLNVILVPQLEFFNDNDWQFRATLCAVLPVYKQSHPDLTYHLISCLKDKSDVVRRTAKKSLTEMGINSKESLRQAMVQLQIIPDVAQKQKELSFLDEELARLSKNQSDYDAINAARIVEWQKLVPLKKIPGSLKDRPDSYNATLVKKGVLTKEDFEKMYGKNNQPKPAALAPACEPDERMSTQRSRTVNNLGTIVKPTIFSQLKVQSAMPSRRPSFDKYWPDPECSVAPSKTGSARNSIYHSSVYGQSSRKSSIYERSTSMKENSQEKLDHRDEEEDDFLTNADIPRISLTRRPSLGGANRHSTARQSIANNITFNNGALQKPTPKTDFFDKPTSEEELRVQKDQYLVSRRTTGTFAGGFRRNSQASPSRPGFGGWGTLRSSIMAGADAADPWGLFKKRDSTTSDESTPKSSRRVSHFGPIVSSHLEAEEKIEVDVDGAIKVYSRRVSMQPLQVSYYKRINIKRGSSLAGEGMLPEDENNLGISLPPVVSVTKTESDEKINQRASRGSMDKGVPIVTVRMKTPPDESAIRPNRIIEAANNYTSTTTIPSAGTGSRRNTITASTTLFDPNSRPWTVDDQQERQKTPAQRKSNANDFISPIRQDSGKRDEPKAWSDHDSVVTSGGNDHT